MSSDEPDLQQKSGFQNKKIPDTEETLINTAGHQQ